jgi:thiamine monophosphate kinase
VDAHLSERFGRGWLELAAGGGEDFELVAAVPEQDVAALLRRWPAELAPLTAIGRLTEGSGVHLLDHRGGTEQVPPRTLARHFT